MANSADVEMRRVHAVQEIANLQSRYMYWLEGHNYERVLQCFAHHPEVSVEIGEGGVYIGRAKVEAMFLQVLRPFLTLPGMMPLHMLTTPVIEVDIAAERGAGMWQTLGCNSFQDEGGALRAVWQQGTYDNLFIREVGEWRILRMRWLANFRTSFDQGWVREPLIRLPDLDWEKMPAEIHPSRPGSEAFSSYDPGAVRSNAPHPPEKQ